jgi:hypothetical protein
MLSGEAKRMPGDDPVDWPKPEEASRAIAECPPAFFMAEQRNVYLCRGGKLLTSTGNIDQGRILYYRARKLSCALGGTVGRPQ